MIRVVAVLTAFLSGSLLGIVLSDIRARRRQIEEEARRVADALGDTVLVDGVQLPKPEDERWTLKDVEFGPRSIKSRSLVLGSVIVGGSANTGYDYVLINGAMLNGRLRGVGPAERKYVAAVWCAYQTRIALKSIR